MYVNARAIIERETAGGTEILLQFRERPGELRRWELPGGRLEEYEPILTGLAREVMEETGLAVTEIAGAGSRVEWTGTAATVECLVPYFVYQTLKGPVDSVGFYFRCRAGGDLTTAGDGASGHRWFPLADLRELFACRPDDFDWLTQGALRFYLGEA